MLTICFFPLHLAFLGYTMNMSLSISLDCFVSYLQSTAVLFNALFILHFAVPQSFLLPFFSLPYNPICSIKLTLPHAFLSLLSLIDTLLKYSEEPDEMTPQPSSGFTISPPIISCHSVFRTSGFSKSDMTVEGRGFSGWHSVPRNPESHLEGSISITTF